MPVVLLSLRGLHIPYNSGIERLGIHARLSHYLRMEVVSIMSVHISRMTLIYIASLNHSKEELDV